MKAYYNEIDPYAAHWLERLIQRRLIPDGVVDRRSIADVRPSDLHGFKQCHFFAGIGGWAYALQLAGWPEDRPVWTGSCPCQPYSRIGKRRGNSDARNLWPVWSRLIREYRRQYGKQEVPVILGEQVASTSGIHWLDGVAQDLEAEDYAVGAAILGAHSIRIPCERQRLYWVGYANGEGLQGHAWHGIEQPARWQAPGGSDAPADYDRDPAAGVDALQLLRRDVLCDSRMSYQRVQLSPHRRMGHGPIQPWERVEMLACSDGWRSAEPGSQPMAYGLPRSLGRGSTLEQRMGLLAAKANRTGRLKGYGNAIVPQLAALFIEASMEAIKGGTA